MNPFAKLQRVSDYLKTLKAADLTNIFVTDQANIVKRLATTTGIVVASARPELSTNGKLTQYDINTVIFVLHADLGNGGTDDKINDLYDSMSEVAKDISLQIISNTEGACSNLRGLSVSKIALTPTASVFGGFFGWILDITLE